MLSIQIFQIVPALLHVFVGIEVTGLSVQFEQKFNYRRPMYLIMEYLWEIEEHKNVFKYVTINIKYLVNCMISIYYLNYFKDVLLKKLKLAWKL